MQPPIPLRRAHSCMVAFSTSHPSHLSLHLYPKGESSELRNLVWGFAVLLLFFLLLQGLKSSSVINASELQLGRYIASEREGLGSVVKRGLSRAPAMFPIM